MSTAPARDDRDDSGMQPDTRPPCRRVTVEEHLGATLRNTRDDCVIDEVPVALVFNGISHAVMLASPADLEDFALGFSLSEGILTAPGELYDCEVEATGDCGGAAMIVHLHIAASRFAALRARRRTLAGRTGCGLCGIDSLHALAPDPAPVHAALSGATAAAPDAISRALTALSAQQPLHALTGAAHAAAWATREGELLLVREDVGRHNALDKLLGAAVRAGLERAAGFVVCTSRASYEMAHKAASLGVGLLVAVSAPTARAVTLAERCGLTLVAFARNQRHVVYTHPQRMTYLPVRQEITAWTSTS